MRLFIAINLSDDMTNALCAMQEELKRMGARGNFSKRENLHLTLAFIGEYGNPSETLDVLKSVPFEPFTLKLDGIRHFNNVYCAGLAHSAELQTYVKRLRRALADKGIPFDRKKFLPHITLIRQISFWDGINSKAPTAVPSNEMSVTRVSLMRSERGKSGMVYTEMGFVETDDTGGRE